MADDGSDPSALDRLSLRGGISKDGAHDAEKKYIQAQVAAWLIIDEIGISSSDRMSKIKKETISATCTSKWQSSLDILEEYFDNAGPDVEPPDTIHKDLHKGIRRAKSKDKMKGRHADALLEQGAAAKVIFLRYLGSAGGCSKDSQASFTPYVDLAQERRNMLRYDRDHRPTACYHVDRYNIVRGDCDRAVGYVRSISGQSGGGRYGDGGREAKHMEFMMRLSRH